MFGPSLIGTAEVVVVMEEIGISLFCSLLGKKCLGFNQVKIHATSMLVSWVSKLTGSYFHRMVEGFLRPIMLIIIIHQISQRHHIHKSYVRWKFTWMSHLNVTLHGPPNILVRIDRSAPDSHRVYPHQSAVRMWFLVTYLAHGFGAYCSRFRMFLELVESGLYWTFNIKRLRIHPLLVKINDWIRM